ncbi:D-methionine transport system permease protein [Clostridium tetanomorphum]|uniref:ABC transporter permease n=1 Tax=Clostridium tetanomorphum TaxID=1553 RepID=A0A923E801_CLOTT|nr:methionine ABC transporter permease [Clostridium tetanomorphum]KAJ52629.1 binding-protein-dependent transport system inner membrane protein [Clostridium tetanomorphum DSM 665]MBC2396816.1 ABC transporter permease [Clostridium tetanomorphum]MBP1863222.1 D-methionine transport system permease protein [Clostridium tetanomorphum]NRS84330.1 D-methionine transport system permease protein [Clostridium tetanomorphum]NRZ97544.1 D-methionine transport system permease protein [Clostridium tetanomorphu
MIKEILITGLKDTVYMVSYATLFAVILGFIFAIILILTDNNGLKPNKFVYSLLDLIINVLRSFPFIILMIAIFPLTKLIVGKSIGRTAAIVPLTIGAAPFVARIIESALKEVDPGLIEAAKSFGATTSQILFKVMIKEAFPSIVRGIILTIINLIGYSTMAGAIGAGGLGDVAIKYGYNGFKTDIMVYTVIVLIILVQFIQSLGNVLYKNLNK